MKSPESLSEELQEAIIRLRAGLTSATFSVRARLEELEFRAAQLRQRAHATAAKLGRDYPWTIMALGGAVGLLMGAALAPRNRH